MMFDDSSISDIVIFDIQFRLCNFWVS